MRFRPVTRPRRSSRPGLVVHTEGEFVIVGDLHGHVPDLVRVSIQFGLRPPTKHIFFGNYMNRGDFSVHTTLSLLALKCRYPRSVYLRGNHEFEDVNKIMGLFAEIRNEYPRPDLDVAFNHVITYLRLAARLNDDVVCLHSGLWPQFVSLDQLKALSLPLAESTDPIVETIAWSDPSADIPDFERYQKRSCCSEFGEHPLAEFLSCHQLKIFVHCHSLVPTGVRFALGNRVVTASSVSNYSEATGCSTQTVASRDRRIDRSYTAGMCKYKAKYSFSLRQIFSLFLGRFCSLNFSVLRLKLSNYAGN
jgi:hypothetical protein